MILSGINQYMIPGVRGLSLNPRNVRNTYVDFIHEICTHVKLHHKNK